MGAGIGRRFVHLLVLVFFLGCAGAESFKIAEDLGKSKRWDEAIVYFEKAVNENPENQDYKQALENAKQESAKIHFEKAKQAFAAQTELNLPALEQVMKEAELANRLDPQNKEITAFYGDLKRKKSDMQSTLKSLYSQADIDMKKEDWLSAIQKFKKINEISPGYEDTGDRLASVNQQATRIYYKQGLDLEEQEDWKGAAAAYKSVLEINPGYQDAARRYEEARGKDNVNYFVKEGALAAAAQPPKWERAVMLYEKAREYDPDNREIEKRLKSIKDKAAQSFFDGAIRDAQQGKLYEAARKLELAKTYAPSLQDNPLYKEFITNRLGAKLIERGERYAEKGKWGNAYLSYQKLESLDPNFKGIFFKVQEAKDNIKKRIRKSIAVFDFKSPSQSRDAGKIVANKLMTFLYRNASGDIRIIERENLESILKELQLVSTQLVDVDAAQKLAKMGGIDTFIMGDVLRFSSEYRDYPTTSQVKVVIDEEDVRNPEYTEWLMLNRNPTEEDLKNAPPKTIKKKNYQLISYKSGYAKISASIESSYKLVDARTGENLFTNTVSGKLTKEDKYQDAVPLANIPHDPLEIATESDVLDELTNQKVSEMGQSVLQKFQNLEVEYYNQAVLQVKRRNHDDAVERFMDAIFDEQMKGISTPVSKKSRESINKLIRDL